MGHGHFHIERSHGFSFGGNAAHHGLRMEAADLLSTPGLHHDFLKAHNGHHADSSLPSFGLFDRLEDLSTLGEWIRKSVEQKLRHPHKSKHLVASSGYEAEAEPASAPAPAPEAVEQAPSQSDGQNQNQNDSPPFKGEVPQGERRDLISKALSMLGMPVTEENLAMVNAIIQNESEWVPGAINLTDGNADAGHPSKGLMQTIEGTFSEWHLPGLDDIWDPLSNIIAGINYAIHRYGSLEQVPGIVSLSQGGPYQPY